MSLSPAVRALREYVAIPSVNPMRRTDIDPEITGERRYAEHVREQMRALGLDVELVGSPERPSVVAYAHASGAQETILVASHLDTVPVDGMQIDPFDPLIEGGRLFGRGACDTKAGMAAAVAALGRVLERGGLRRNIVLVGEADEELGSAGIREVLGQLRVHPDWLIATEPTSLRVVTRHKGVLHARLVAQGRACHASAPHEGINAIVALARATIALDGLATRLESRRDERLGPGTLSPGVVRGGSAPNIVPDAAELLIDRRLLPGENADSVRREIEAALRDHAADGVEIDWCRVEKAALLTPDDHASVVAVAAALHACGHPAELDVASFGTDAGVAQEAGVPGVVFGPGDVAQAHTSREFVSIDQVDAATDVLERVFGD
jgi:acetylornithine deacetylase